MTSSTDNYKLIPHEYTGPAKICADELCTRKIGHYRINKQMVITKECFLDLLNDGSMLCDNCGKCLRYARKCAVRRGEPIESATQNFEG